MNLKVYSTNGSSSEEKSFDIPALEEGKGHQALRDAVIAIQANRRQGNACAKKRDEVAGSDKKIYKQKGTGRARHGDAQAPIFVGGGVVFGPRPRDYTKKVNHKVKLLALHRALTDVVTEGHVKIIKAFEFTAPKTKSFLALMQNIGITGKLLIVDDGYDANTLLSARNVEGVNIIEADSVHPWDLIRYPTVLMTESAINKVIKRIQQEATQHATA